MYRKEKIVKLASHPGYKKKGMANGKLEMLSQTLPWIILHPYNAVVTTEAIT